MVRQQKVVISFARKTDTVRELEQQPELLRLLPLPGRRLSHMMGTERRCKYRIGVVRQ